MDTFELSKVASKQGFALCLRLSFAVSFNLRIINASGLPGPLWGLSPFKKEQHSPFMKGAKAHRGRDFVS